MSQFISFEHYSTLNSWLRFQQQGGGSITQLLAFELPDPVAPGLIPGIPK